MAAGPGAPTIEPMHATRDDHGHAEARRVVIADDHEGVRRALDSLIRLSGAGVVVGRASDLRTAGRLARMHWADVLVVDADLLAEQRSAVGPLTAAVTIIAVGMERHPAARERALRLGASSYIVKDQAHTELADALLDLTPTTSRARQPG